MSLLRQGRQARASGGPAQDLRVTAATQQIFRRRVEGQCTDSAMVAAEDGSRLASLGGPQMDKSILAAISDRKGDNVRLVGIDLRRRLAHETASPSREILVAIEVEFAVNVNPLHFGEIGERIFVENRQVGVLADLDRAHAVIDGELFSGIDSDRR